MYRNFFRSISFLNSLIIILLFVFSSIYFKPSIYGLSLENSWQSFFLFNPKAPLTHYGIPLLASFYFHISLKHFLLNTGFYALISILIEQKYGTLKTFLITIGVHTLTLLALSLLYFLSPHVTDQLYSGASASIIGLFCFYYFQNKGFFSLSALGAFLLGSAYFENSQDFISNPHLLAYLTGLLISLLYLRLSRN